MFNRHRRDGKSLQMLTTHTSVPRPGLVALLFVLASCMFIPAQLGLGQSSQPGQAKPWASWEKVTIQNGTIVRVGKQQLPVPIVLRPTLYPLGKIAAVPSATKQGLICHFVLFFPVGKASEVRAWVQSFSQRFPVANPRDFAVKSGVSFGGVYTFHARSKQVRIGVSAHPVIGRAASIPADDASTRAIKQLFMAPKSPVKNENGWEMMSIAYSSP
jgi:hypothetical protein